MIGLDADPAIGLADETRRRQELASDPFVSAWADANAGAGKTKVLIDRIARLLLAGAEPGRILAVTYTKAAAAEMQARLFSLLGRWAVTPDDELRAALQRLAPEYGRGRGAGLAHARALFARALETPGGLKIQTIHAFCQNVLRRFPLEASLAPGFEVLEAVAADALRAQALDAAAARDPKPFLALARESGGSDWRGLLGHLAARSRAADAVRAAGGCPEAVAARLRARLALAADDNRERAMRVALDFAPQVALEAARDVLAAGSSTEKAAAAHLANMLNAPDSETAWSALRAVFVTGKGELRLRPFWTKTLDGSPALLAAFGARDDWPGALGALVLDVEDRLKAFDILDLAVPLNVAAVAMADALDAAKTRLGVLDFDDLLTRVARLLTSGEGAARWVLYKLDSGLDHVLIDEAQDTSPEQWDLLAPIFEALEDDASGQPRTRFVVGDAKQSIYSFQGARPDRFHAERDGFSGRADGAAWPHRVLQFELSFRSTPEVLAAVDAVWAATSGEGVRHAAMRADQAGQFAFWDLAAGDREAEDGAAWDQPLDYVPARNASAKLADRLSHQIARWLEPDGPEARTVWGEGGRPRAMRPDDIMILFRTRGPLFDRVLRSLKRRGVPVAGVDRIEMKADLAIRDLLALARFAMLPQDDFNLACVLKGPFCGLVDDDSALFDLAYGRQRTSLWQRVLDSEDPDVAHVRRWLLRLLEAAGRLDPYGFLAFALERPIHEGGATGWDALLHRLGEEAREPAEALLLVALNGAGSRPVRDLHALIRAADSDNSVLKREMERGVTGVRLMTVHGAKGLEAPVVILPDTTASGGAGGLDARYDHASACWLQVPSAANTPQALRGWLDAARADADAEQARLLYVAMTRARDMLVVCGCEWGNSKEGRRDGSWHAQVETALERLGPPLSQSVPPGEPADSSWRVRIWGEGPPPAGGSVPVDAPAFEGVESRSPHLPSRPEWVARPPKSDAAPPTRVAPSGLVPVAMELHAASPRDVSGRAARFLRGRLVHELLERLPDLPPETRRAAARARLDRESQLDASARAALIEEVFAVLEHPEFADLFGPGSRAEAALAGRMPELPGDVVVNGAVDRLAVLPDRILAVDFKTNRPPPDAPEAVAPAYLAQMAAYRSVLRAIWPDRPVRCALLWTDGPRLMALPDALLDAAVEALRESSADFT